MHSRLRLFAAVTFVLLAGLVPQYALACPTCKDSLTDNYVQAYGISIVFMMSMPFIIFGALSAYFYYEVCKARRQKEQEGQGSRRAGSEVAADKMLGSAGASPSP